MSLDYRLSAAPSDLETLLQQWRQYQPGTAPTDLWVTSADSAIDTLVERVMEVASPLMLRCPGSRLSAGDGGLEDGVLDAAINTLNVRRIVVCVHSECSSARRVAPIPEPRRYATRRSGQFEVPDRDRPASRNGSLREAAGRHRTWAAGGTGTRGAGANGKHGAGGTPPPSRAFERLVRGILAQEALALQARNHLVAVVEELKSHPIVVRAAARRELAIEGLFYSCASGTLHYYDARNGTFELLSDPDGAEI